MSSRRFAAYFIAIAAGSTFAFASTLRGQPMPTEAAMRDKGMTSTATDAGLDVLPPETVRLFRLYRHRHTTAAGTARVTSLQ